MPKISNTKKSKLIRNSYDERIKVGVDICKFLNTEFGIKSHIAANETEANTSICFDDQSALFFFKTSTGEFGVSEPYFLYGQSHQFHAIIKYLCLKLYTVDLEICQKIYVGDRLKENVDMDYVKSIYIHDYQLKEMYWKKNGFQDTNKTILDYKSLYADLIRTKIKPFHEQARQSITLITNLHILAGDKHFHIKSDLKNLAMLCNHASGTTWFNEFFLNTDEYPNQHIVPWNLFWNTIDLVIKDQNFDIDNHLEVLHTQNEKFFEILQELKNCHFHINNWKKME
jgi:hypothetical protein